MKELENYIDMKYIEKDGITLGYISGSAARVKFPSLDEDLALFLGILWGDGWIVSRDVALRNCSWRIGMVEDDKPLVHAFVELTTKIFGITPKIHDRVTKLEAYFCNRIVYEMLCKVYGFPDGDKINRLKIPKQILGSHQLMKRFLCGLFSTDGKFIIVRKGYPRIGLDSASLEFIKEVEEIMKRLGFNPRFSIRGRKVGNNCYTLVLNGHIQARHFHSEIGFIGEKANKLGNFPQIASL